MLKMSARFDTERTCNFISRGILSEYLSLLALHLSGTASLRTGTRPPSCFYLNNRLYMSPVSLVLRTIVT